MWGKKKPSPKEQAREVKKDVRHTQRDLERELQTLDREETKLIADIKKEAKGGNQQKALKVMATNLVRLRAQKDRLLSMKATVTGVGYKASMMASQAAVGQAMGNVAGVMGQMNAQMDPKKMAAVMQDFARQSEMTSVQEEMLTDALSDAFDGDGVEEEADTVVNQVLDEIGIHTASQMADAPTGKLPARATATAESTEDEDKAALEALEKLLGPVK